MTDAPTARSPLGAGATWRSSPHLRREPPGSCRIVAILVRTVANPHQVANWLGYDAAHLSFGP
jgi:hypothetical protein